MQHRICSFIVLLAMASVYGMAYDETPLGHENLYASLPAPQAQALYRYGSIPASPYSGKANVSIPIYSAEISGIPLTVSLNYDTQGVLVNTVPGCTGHGWALNAGGAVTREQRGWPDEAVIVADPAPVRFHNYFHSLQKLSEIGGFSDLTEIAFYTQDIWKMNTYDTNVCRYFTDKYDFCADIFHFNFLGKSGYFFYDTDGQWKVQCDENIKVDFDVDDEQNYIESFGGQQYYSNDIHNWKHHKSIRGFTLTDDSGNKYIFGGSDSDIDYSIDALNSTSSNYTSVLWTANSWYLSRVEDRFGHVVYDFFYSRGPCVYQAVYRKEKQTVRFNGIYEYEYKNENAPFCITLSAPVYLASIDINDDDTLTPETYISLVYDESLRGDEMYPYASSGNALLLYTQFGNIYGSEAYSWDDRADMPKFAEQSKNFSTSTERNLNSTGIPLLSEIGISSNGTEVKRYGLQYSRVGKVHLSEVQVVADGRLEAVIGKYTLNYLGYGLLPATYYSSQTDLWGYYNGNSGSGRSANPNMIQNGMLGEIIYPTGGKTKLTYETNYISSTEAGGGLRIRKMEDYDIDGTTLLNYRRYTYSSPMYSVPKPRTQGKYHTYYDNLTIDYDCDYSLIPLTDYYGPTVGYWQVTEENSTSKTVYTYTSMADESPSNIFGSASLFNKKGSRAFMRGRLATKTICDLNNIPYRKYIYSYYCPSGDLYKSYATNISAHSTVFKSVGNSYLHASRPVITTVSWMAGCVYPVFLSKNNLSGITTYTYTYSPVDTIVEYTSYQRFDIKLKGCTQPYQFIQSETSPKKGTTSIYEYPTDSVIYNDFAQIHYFPIVKSTVCRNNALLYSDTIVYANVSGALNPHYEIRDYGQVRDTLVTYISFSPGGLPEKYIQKGMPPTKIFHDCWGHMLGKVCSTVNLNQITMNPASPPVNMLTYNGNSIFSIPNTTAATYKWNQMQLLESITTGTGQTIYYYYDTVNRLTEIRDSSGHTVQSFDYHYLTGE